jgi:hypothetical protein
MELSANDGGSRWAGSRRLSCGLPFLWTSLKTAFSPCIPLGFGASPEEAYVAAQRTLSMGAFGLCGPLFRLRFSLYGMTVREAAAAMGMVSALSFPHVRGPVTEGREALWRLGLSGDLPIIAAEIGSSDSFPLPAN